MTDHFHVDLVFEFTRSSPEDKEVNVSVYSEIVFKKEIGPLKSKIRQFYEANIEYLVKDIFLPTLETWIGVPEQKDS